ncbi:metallophosphoesterase family protein [Candidatus Methylobacter oryzae]|uniref:Metallophosphoesterase n=1 Tax=Candidatus Methylobacter oryzae TaxID=2497749 RepID=A0ABY3CG36_9GAMM|nr:metallophosphoesterase [Candidatus Methylobacter oryzae]TRX01436.1 metallophosphoesterase [Candidatus Methylobacter oryzae]
MNPNNKILFAGDPHGDFRPLIAAVHKYRPEAVVLLGDYDLEMPLEICLQEIIGLTEIWWIAGNHDFETPVKYKNLFHSALAGNSLHLKVTEIAGLRIAGLGGIFLGRVWYPPQPPRWRNKQHFLNGQAAGAKSAALSLKYQGAIWPDEFHALKALKADILVTHEAPGGHRHGFDVIGELGVAMGVKHIFHGHLHENYTGIVKNNIKVFGVANRAVADLMGNTLKDED